MAVINMASIIPKINAYAGSAQGKKVIWTATKNIAMKFGASVSKHSPQEAADKFVEIMESTVKGMEGSTLGSTAVSAASNFISGTPFVSTSSGAVAVTIPFTFQGDLHRYSLRPDIYGGIDNIIALLNNGYSASHTVFGNWHGKDTASLKDRDGAGFIQSAVGEFMSKYAKEYNVLSIEIDGAYT